MSHRTTIRGLAALIPMIMTLTGCAREGADPTVAAAADLQRTLELDGALDLSGPGGDNLPGGPGAPAGLAALQLGKSAFWGHNAVLRVAPFMVHARLPERTASMLG